MRERLAPRRRTMSVVVDHVGFRASDLSASRAMYEAALGELGFSILGEGEYEGDAYVLFGATGNRLCASFSVEPAFVVNARYREASTRAYAELFACVH